MLVVQHAEHETMGSLEPLCRGAGMAWHVCRVDAGEPVPPATQPYDGVILLGGPMSVDEGDRYPFLHDEVRLLQRAIRRQLPVLGICLGAQLLAQAAGGRVVHGPAPEIGWFPIQLTDAGRRDPLFEGLPAEFMAFHWHGDTFEPPPKAIHLASSAKYSQQSFRLGERLYGLQFHGEVTAAMVQRWVQESPAIAPQPILDGLAQHGAAVEQMGRIYLTNFLKNIAIWCQARNE